MNNANTIELAEMELDRLLLLMHKQGLTYWAILYIMLNRCVTLMLQKAPKLKSG